MLEMSSVVEGRSRMYRFLSSLYLTPPTEEVVARVRGEEFILTLAPLFPSSLVGHFQRFQEQWNGDHAGLRQEYDDLFIVPLGRYVTPYEAVYRDERVVGEEKVRGLLMGPSTVAVKKAYREAGAGISPECQELPDHVGVELSFMHFLCEQEREVRERKDSIRARNCLVQQREFLQGHLAKWIPSLCAAIVEKAASDFYKGVAELTRDFVLSDAETLQETLGEECQEQL